MSKWDKFAIDAAALNQQANALNDSDFEEVPNGKYEVSLDSLELGESKKGFPMIRARFTILEGEWKNRKLFFNQVVIMGDENDKYRVHASNVFLRSLESGLTVTFEGLDDYDALITAIADKCASTYERGGAEYLLELGERRGYKTYTILERFETEEAPASAPTYPNCSEPAATTVSAAAQDTNEDIPF